MRRLLTVGLLLVAACSGDQTVSTTTSGVVSTTTSTNTSQPVSSTSSSPTSTTSTSSTTTTIPQPTELAYQLVGNVSFPIQLTALAGAETSYLIAKEGTVWTIRGDLIDSDPVLDISDRVRDAGEQGLLGIALHPYQNELVYLHYTAGDGDTVVSEFRFVSPAEIDPDSERVLLRLNQPARNHNGGMIQFGPDGRLYLGLGDGGGANDRFGNGQNRETLLGGIVAINVAGDPRPVLWSYGLRNPWRFWIDGWQIYIADVGQGRYEEVSVADLSVQSNFGWPITEAMHCFRPSSGCDTEGLTLPLIEVPHGDAGTCSITGGIVYRGDRIAAIAGHYFYSDYCGGYLRSFRIEDGSVTDLMDWTDQVGVPGRVTGFGVDGIGEMYVLTTESVLRVVAVP